MKADRRTYWEYYLDSLDDSTLVSILPFIAQMAVSDEASASAMSGSIPGLPPYSNTGVVIPLTEV